MTVGTAFFSAPASVATLPYSTTVLADSPVIYYHLDETSGTTYADASGNGNTGTAFGTITQGQAGIFAGSTNSIQFAVANSAYIAPATDPFAGAYAGSFTFSCFFNATNLTQQNAICSRGIDGSDYTMHFLTNTNGSIQGSIITTSTGAMGHDASSGVGVIVAGTPYHLVFRYTAGTGFDIFVNNANVASLGFTATTWRASAEGLNIGRMITPLYCAGKIDEVAFFNTALSNARISAHYAARAS